MLLVLSECFKHATALQKGDVLLLAHLADDTRDDRVEPKVGRREQVVRNLVVQSTAHMAD